MTHKENCNVFYLEYTTSGVDEILGPDPRIGQPRDWKQWRTP